MILDRYPYKCYSVYRMSRDITTIQITRGLKDFLASQTIHKGETYDEILKRLLSKIWGVNFQRPEAADAKRERYQKVI